ncbi:hypothetical protein AB0D08_09680 [Kitasatospora sp. NPDC048540]|uniref:hypothetical protein n=1 Tax=Kitasatospora sp. NPDC048540 TaxID=3155634 RepID=UPI0033D16C31
MNAFDDLADPAAPTPPPADALVLELPAGSSFEEGCDLLEQAVAQDPQLRPWIVIRVAGEPGEVVTGRAHLRDNYGMTVPMAGGEGLRLVAAITDEPIGQAVGVTYACPVSGCAEGLVTVYGDAPRCPVHGDTMTERGILR